MKVKYLSVKRREKQVKRKNFLTQKTLVLEILRKELIIILMYTNHFGNGEETLNIHN